MKLNRRQSGYMIEIPIMIAVVAVVLSIILPKLPPVAAKVVAVLGALALIAGAYYMIVIPGWQPGAKRLRPPWNLLLFVPVAALIAFVAGAYVVLG